MSIVILSNSIATMITICDIQPTMIEIIIFDTMYSKDLSTDVHSYVAGSTFIVFEQLISFQFISSQGILSPIRYLSNLLGVSSVFSNSANASVMFASV